MDPETLPPDLCEMRANMQRILALYAEIDALLEANLRLREMRARNGQGRIGVKVDKEPGLPFFTFVCPICLDVHTTQRLGDLACPNARCGALLSLYRI